MPKTNRRAKGDEWLAFMLKELRSLKAIGTICVDLEWLIYQYRAFKRRKGKKK